MSVVRFHFKKAAIFSESNFKALIFLFSCGGGWGVTEIYKEHLPLGWVVYEIYKEHLPLGWVVYEIYQEHFPLS